MTITNWKDFHELDMWASIWKTATQTQTENTCIRTADTEQQAEPPKQHTLLQTAAAQHQVCNLKDIPYKTCMGTGEL